MSVFFIQSSGRETIDGFARKRQSDLLRKFPCLKNGFGDSGKKESKRKNNTWIKKTN